MSDLKKVQARLKRESMDIAGEIHDIVEDRLWEEYLSLPALSADLCEKIREYKKAQKLYEDSVPVDGSNA